MCEGKVAHLCIAMYAVHGQGLGAVPFAAALQPEPRLERRMIALQKEASTLFHPPPDSYRSADVRVWPDMIDHRGSLGLSTIMDLYERQRTELIGGQARAKDSRGRRRRRRYRRRRRRAHRTGSSRMARGRSLSYLPKSGTVIYSNWLPAAKQGLLLPPFSYNFNFTT